MCVVVAGGGWRRLDTEVDSAWLECDSSDISWRCSVSAVSESPCSSDRVTKSSREGDVGWGGAGGGEWG